MEIEIFSENSSYIKLSGLSDSQNPSAFISSATVSAVISEAYVGGALSTISMSYVAASNGDYVGIISASTPLLAGNRYNVVVTATANGATGRWEGLVTVKKRGFGIDQCDFC